MRRLYNDYKKKKNNGIAYEEFHLTKEMDHCPTKWEEYDFAKQTRTPQLLKHEKLMTIFLPEFMNRYSFVSSYAWLINSFRNLKGVTRRHAIELLYVALLTPSQIQFQHVVQYLKKGFNHKNNMCERYLNYCKKYGLCANGGPQPRFMAGIDTDLPKGKKEINENIFRLKNAIDCLNKGEMMNSNGVFSNNQVVVNVKGVGAARAISFPSLCCFTGLGVSWQAMQTAKQAVLNSVTGSGCTGDKRNKLSKLGQLLRVAGDSPPYDNSYYYSILEAVGKSVGDVQSTIKNVASAFTRTHKKEDMFVKGQTLHCLFLDPEVLQACGGVENDASQVKTAACGKNLE